MIRDTLIATNITARRSFGSADNFRNDFVITRDVFQAALPC